MKNKIILILFSLFAFAVPQQAQPMSSVKEVALASWLLWQKNPYESWMLVNYGLLGIDQSNYEGVPLFRHEGFRKILRATIGILLSKDFIKKNNLYAKALGYILALYTIHKIQGQTIINLNGREVLASGFIYTLIFLKESGLLKYAPKYVFILLCYSIRNSIINNCIPGANL